MSCLINLNLLVAIVSASVLTGCTSRIKGVKIAGHRGSLAGSSNQVEFYPDLGYVLVVLGNTDSGTEAIAAHARVWLTQSAPP